MVVSPAVRDAVQVEDGVTLNINIKSYSIRPGKSGKSDERKKEEQSRDEKLSFKALTLTLTNFNSSRLFL